MKTKPEEQAAPKLDVGSPEAYERGTAGQPLSLRKPQSIKQEPEEGLSSQCWETQWREFPQPLASALLGDAPIAPFEGAAPAGQGARDEGETGCPSAFKGTAQQADSRLDAVGGQAAGIKTEEAVSSEARRWRFRQLGYQEAEGPREVYVRLRELCCGWLQPEMHSKEQMLDLVILEQFLAVLPLEMRRWVEGSGTESCVHALALAEDFLLRQQEGEKPAWQNTGAIERVVVSFPEEEPSLEDSDLSALHGEVVLDSGANEASLEMDNLGPKRKRRSFEAGFKLKVVSRAEESNNSIASREFCVDEKQVREWRKQKADLEQIPKAKKAQRGLTASYGALEIELHKWVLECRQNGYCITRMGIRLRALQMAKDDKYKAPGIEKFVASAGWCSSFMNRFGLCLRQRTKISQKLPQDLEDKIMSFHSFIIKQRRIHNYDLASIGNMDETAMTFDLPSNRTVASLGEKTVFLRTTGNEKNHFTVVLSCLANGTKLRPVIIFKRKTLPKQITLPPGITVRAHVKGWMDEDGTKKWLKEIWNRRPGAALKKKPSLLVWDMFRAHLSDGIKKLAKSSQITLAVIPGGLTSVLQPLEVSLNKPFKDRVQRMWHEWMSSGQAQLTKGGNLTEPDIELITKWVRDAWEDIPEDTVRRAFQKCGISNAMDGSEDSTLYENDSSDDHDDCDLSDDNVYDDLTPAEALFGHRDDDKESSFEGL